MLTADGCAARRQNLRERLGDYDLLIVSHPYHIFYLSGCLARPTELAGWGLNFLLIDREGHSRLLADNWSGAGAQAAFVDQVDIWPWYDFTRSAPERYAAAAQSLSDALAKHYPKLNRAAIDRPHLPALARDALGAAHLDDLTPTLAAMRQAKYADELACIRRAIRAAEAGHAAARRLVRAGLAELELYAEVEKAITLAAGEPVLMLCDIVAGKRAEGGGGAPTHNLLREGDLVILDLFPLVAGYRADITNTLCVGEPTQAQRDHLAVLQAAMQSAEAVLRPGVIGAQAYAACRRPLAEAGMGELFSHHAGHGLGLGHPEPPYLVPGSQDVLQAGNVVTLEPGAYKPGWGGARIEHNYLITETGFERLSQHEIGL